MLGKLPVPGRPTNLYDSRARAYCACSRCGWGWFGHFYSHLSSHLSLPLFRETARYRLKYCLKGPLNSKPTNLSANDKQIGRSVSGVRLISERLEENSEADSLNLSWQYVRMAPTHFIYMANEDTVKPT